MLLVISESESMTKNKPGCGVRDDVFVLESTVPGYSANAEFLFLKNDLSIKRLAGSPKKVFCGSIAYTCFGHLEFSTSSYRHKDKKIVCSIRG